MPAPFIVRFLAAVGLLAIARAAYALGRDEAEALAECPAAPGCSMRSRCETAARDRAQVNASRPISPWRLCACEGCASCHPSKPLTPTHACFRLETGEGGRPGLCAKCDAEHGPLDMSSRNRDVG